MLKGVLEVFIILFYNMVDNLVNVLVNGNYIGIFMWVVGLGLGLCYVSEVMKVLF